VFDGLADYIEQHFEHRCAWRAPCAALS